MTKVGGIINGLLWIGMAAILMANGIIEENELWTISIFFLVLGCISFGSGLYKLVNEFEV